MRLTDLGLLGRRADADWGPQQTPRPGAGAWRLALALAAGGSRGRRARARTRRRWLKDKTLRGTGTRRRAARFGETRILHRQVHGFRHRAQDAALGFRHAKAGYVHSLISF